MRDPAEMDRKEWMGVLARAPAAVVAQLWEAAGLPEPAHDWLRPPEIGAVMVRGRAGATGAPFNLGEMTVTRCALRLADGRDGHACVQGRDKDHARRAALADALMQGAEAGEVRAALLSPLAEAEAEGRAALARRAAATKVEFFTLMRGDA
ncbi:MAG: phosphonate C-P lyase system protein PhnG [Paracoccaceae bacterium]|jgi:alpha-D-ribose 1-methylphosphonate 5-triphosphate synthase subunit PhnG|nr:phosphonate C-P lyase system protein PhnG [Paracoccaceae bacterium]